MRPACRHAVGSPLPRNGPRVSSSEELDGVVRCMDKVTAALHVSMWQRHERTEKARVEEAV